MQVPLPQSVGGHHWQLRDPSACFASLRMTRARKKGAYELMRIGISTYRNGV